ncbi:hypothetical protein CVT26_003743 [Gymnopilus dilepis]|uniref:Uncharacterized protein n=1 Tax=Gymnopilus dilepis TaxID=231916 RepID=A0A409VRZ7_9AGAR|nr:hypothetical protein CVT26_003743 [Gymnopilus dilepis]
MKHQFNFLMVLTALCGLVMAVPDIAAPASSTGYRRSVDVDATPDHQVAGGIGGEEGPFFRDW